MLHVILLFIASQAHLEWKSILQPILEHDDGKFLWYHPRAVAVSPTHRLITLQKHLKVSDYYSGLYTMESGDAGKTWTKPELQTALDWVKSEHGVTVAVADVTPGWHAPTGKVIAVGAQVRYSPKGQQLEDVPHSNQTAYAVYEPSTKQWSSWQIVPVPDHADFNFARSACSQWHVQPDGTVLLPFYHGTSADKPYHVTVMSFSFDGHHLKLKQQGNRLSLPVVRGLCEPSIIFQQNAYYLTLRNDLRAYVSTSKDGLHFSPINPWLFDDGTELGSYNTQQHWVQSPENLYLVYTRRGANNDHIIRNRAPLFIAKVDTKNLRVIKQSERILIPERGGEMGNFGACTINAAESWVTVSEGIWSDDARRRGAKGATFISRIEWPSEEVNKNK
ncbi:MAG: exo-alpha-sialidase [Planctomycetia bacterium]|nr:exo-alpha-sialidase [Planctomycetia bacterium]